MKVSFLFLLLSYLALGLSLRAEVVTLKGTNGNMATLDVQAVTANGLSVIPAGSSQRVEVAWKQIDLDYLRTNYPDLEKRRLAAATVSKDGVFASNNAVTSLADVKANLVKALLSMHLRFRDYKPGIPIDTGWDLIRVAAAPDDPDFRNAIRSLNPMSRKITAALQAAQEQLKQIPANGDTRTWEVRVIQPVLAALPGIVNWPSGKVIHADLAPPFTALYQSLQATAKQLGFSS